MLGFELGEGVVVAPCPAFIYREIDVEREVGKRMRGKCARAKNSIRWVLGDVLRGSCGIQSSIV